MRRFLELVVFYVRSIATSFWLLLAALISLPLGLISFGNVKNNYRFMRIYGPLGRWILGLKVEERGVENLLAYRPCIYVANHQSGADIPLLGYIYPPGTVVIGKWELIFIPFWGLMFFSFGNIGIHRKNKSHSVAGLGQALKRMREKNCSIFLMPEGTRNASGEGLLPFKKGAFHMAIEAQVPIVPSVCASLGSIVNQKKKISHSASIVIETLPPIETKGMTLADVDRLRDLVREKMGEALARINRESVIR